MEKEFGDLHIPSKSVADKTMSLKYRVYSNSEQFIIVEANSALEAIRKSGVSSPVKIDKEMYYHQHFVNQDFLDVYEPDPEIIEQQDKLLVSSQPDISMFISTTDGESEDMVE